jgi:MarR family transcriptional regulator, lower aerobic nicotinate degradation pathway regulator
VVWLLGRASLRGQHLAYQLLASAGARRWHYAVLATLAEFGPAAQADIGRRLGIDRSDMVAILNDLERAGHVSRLPDPSDRRRKSVSLTESGRTALDRLDGLIAEADATLLEPLSPTEREQLVGLLERIVGAASLRPVARPDV